MNRHPGYGVTVQPTTSAGRPGHAIGTARVYWKSSESPRFLFNEFVVSRLAAGVGLPTPPGDVGRIAPSQFGWATADLQYNGVALRPIEKQAALSAPGVSWVAAGVAVFDAWVYNTDRHAENLLYHEAAGLWMIDHEHCLGGPSHGDGRVASSHLQQLAQKAPHNRVFKAGELKQPDVDEWCGRLRSLPTSVVRGVLREAGNRRLGSSKLRGAVGSFLLRRREIIASLVAASFSKGGE